MKGQKRNDNAGITLVALVVSIVVMLILAGVSINAVVGENGVITQAQKATYSQKIANYLEELELNIISAMTADGISTRNEVTVIGDNVKNYIPSLEDNDVGSFAIINGQLYYVGTDETESEVCSTLGVTTGDESSIENQALIAIITQMAGDAFTTTDDDGNTDEAGIKLYDKNLTNGDKWKIITEVSNNETVATYGTGWYYVEAGTTIDGVGTLKYSYIINYETSKAVLFDGNVHTMLAYGSNIAVTDNLVFNIDPINMSDSSGESWGDATLVGFSNEGDYDEDGNQVSGYYGTGILLDGVDDEIDFYAGDDFEEGFTLSYYGKYMGESTHYFSKQDSDENTESIAYSCRFYFTSTTIGFNTTKNYAYSDWSVSDDISNNGNLSKKWGTTLTKGDDVYIDVEFNSDNYEFSVYLNGTYLDSTTVEESYWNGGNYWSPVGGKEAMESDELVCRIGCDFRGNPAAWKYGQLDFYCVRLYNTCLSDDELTANYNATVSYHNILVNGGTAESGGDTDGGDLSEIE